MIAKLKQLCQWTGRDGAKSEYNEWHINVPSQFFTLHKLKTNLLAKKGGKTQQNQLKQINNKSW